MYVRVPPTRLARAHGLRLARSTGLAGLGYYDTETMQLSGFGRSLRKSVKKVGRAVKKVVPKVVKFAAPVVGFAFGGPAGAAAGLALARGAQPGGFNLKLAARGAAYGYAGGLALGAAQAGIAKMAVSRAAMAAPQTTTAFTGMFGTAGSATGAVVGAAPGAVAGAAQPSIWSNILSGVGSALKGQVLTTAKDLVMSKVLSRGEQQVADATGYAAEPSYYPYPVQMPDGSIGVGAVGAGGGGFLEPGQTMGDEELALAQGQPAPASVAPLVLGAIALGLLFMH